MKKLSAAKQRFLENATFIAASRLIFSRLRESGAPILCLSDLVETTSGGTPDRKVSNYYGGRISWLKSGELNDGFIDHTEESITEEGLRNSSAKIYPNGTLVVALYGATVGKTGILTIDAASNQAVCAVIPRTKEVTTRYLYWFFRYKRPEFLNSSFGGAQPNISQRVIRETKIPLPSTMLQEHVCDFLEAIEKRQNGLESIDLPNLPPQLSGIKSIVERIEKMAALIEEARELRRRTDEEMDIVLSSILELIFERNDNKKWPIKKLIDEDRAIVIAGQHILAKDHDSSGDGTPYLTGPADFGPKVAEIKRWTHTPKALAFPGDILLTVKGAGVGKINFAPNVEAAIGRQLMAIRPDQSELLSEFVYFFLLHRFKHFQSIATATTVPGFKKSNVEELEIPIPPISEQHNIVAHLDAMQSKLAALQRHQAETAAELDALMPSILERAFKGEL